MRFLPLKLGVVSREQLVVSLRFSNSLTINHILFISILIHIITAIFSTGYGTHDEHFEIIEFLNFKLGNIPASDLTYEYSLMMRSWFQIYFYKTIYHIGQAVGIESPFTHVFLFRIISSLLGVFAIYRLYFSYIRFHIERTSVQLITFTLLNLSYFIPYLHARTSSENLSTSLFILGFTYFLSEDKSHIYNNSKQAFISGLLFGAAYLCRFQVGIMVMFTWFWGVHNRKNSTSLMVCAIAIVLVMLSGFFIDYLGYEKWSFAAWNMLKYNLLAGKMDLAGIKPWHYFISLPLHRGIFPVNFLLILSMITGWYQFRHNPLTWATMPFVVFHSLLGHKELRFIYSAIILSPLFLGLLVDKYHYTIKKRLETKFFTCLLYLTVLANAVGLIYFAVYPASSNVELYRYLYNKNINTLYVLTKPPHVKADLNEQFYGVRSNLITKKLPSLDLRTSYHKKYVYIDSIPALKTMDRNKNCQLLWTTYPHVVFRYQKIIDLLHLKRKPVRSVYQC